MFFASPREISARYGIGVNIKDIRKSRLQLLLAETGGRAVDLAALLGKRPAQISQWLGDYRTISEESAREIERKARKPPGWLDRTAGSAAPEVAPEAPAPTKSPPGLTDALQAIGAALAADLPPDVRVDVADALRKLAERGGNARDQAQVLQLLTGPHSKPQALAA